MRAIEFDPFYAEAHFNMGIALASQGRYEQAVEAYKEAISINPLHAAAHNNMGNALQELASFKRAIESYQAALIVMPQYPDALNNLGNALQQKGQYLEAIEAYQKALAIEPKLYQAQAQLIFAQRQICDWSDYKDSEEIISFLWAENANVPPSGMLALEDNPSRQKHWSILWAQNSRVDSTDPIQRSKISERKKIRVGFFSSDFHDHATMYLLSGLFRERNQERFEYFVYSYSTTKVGDMLAELKKNVDRFEDIQFLSDEDVVGLVRAHHLDIAIDLKGYTRQSRSKLFKAYLAPIQINWLGYPGTMGCEYIDYIIADEVVIPEEQQKNYSEKVIYLPDCYQPNDDQRKISPVVKPRIDYGLPADAFVFCCFNQSYKISPVELDIWARVLQRIDHGVLWLLDSNRWAKDNLKKEIVCLLYTSPSPRDRQKARMPSSA